MRNATTQDVEEAQRTGALKEDVMYEFIDWKVHGKNVHEDLAWHIQDTLADNSGGVDKVVIGETNEGVIIDIALSSLRPLSKGGSAFTPRKSRPAPVKGTRPERRIPVDIGTEIKVGDVVLLRLDRERALVTGKTEQGYILKLIERKEGYYIHMIYKCELDSIILPYEEPKPVILYQYGQRFDNPRYGPQLLAQVDAYKAVLISLTDGNRFTDPVEVKCVRHVTQQEFDMISGGVKFTKQSDSSE